MGEIKALLFNHSVDGFPVKVGDWVAQIILERIDTPRVKRVASLDKIERGTNGFGSMGTQSLA